MLDRSADARASMPPPVVEERHRLGAPGDERAVAELQDLANDGQLSRGAWMRVDGDWREVGAAEIAGGLTEMALARTLVAEDGSGIIGMLNFVRNAPAGEPTSERDRDPIARPFLALRAALGDCIYLRAMAVRHAARGRGVAARMLDLAEGVAGRERARLGVIVHEANERLIASYQKRGYRSMATEPVLFHVSYPIGSLLVALRREAD